MGKHATAGRRRRDRWVGAWLAIVVTLIVGCGNNATPWIPAGPSAAPTLPASPGAGVVALPVRCPEASFDPGVSLGPEFQADVFVNDESAGITRAFVSALGELYAGRTGAACAWFTGSGLHTAVAADSRLREVMQGELRIEGNLVLRVAFERSYDLRNRPPVLPIDAVFDLMAGATVVDVPTGVSTTTTGDERIALRVEFLFDGHRWRADRVGPISTDDSDWAALPTSLPPGAPCVGFRRDAAGTAFDDTAGSGARVWCDADGQGRVIRQPDQLVMFTRYPCDAGRAAVLTIGRPLGMPVDRLVRYEYVRDPAGEFLAQGWVTSAYVGDAPLPGDAASTGWTNGNIEIWISPDRLDQAIYVKRGDTVERWPRAAAQWGVIDCN
jgi:hypothetical protein